MAGISPPTIGGRASGAAVISRLFLTMQAIVILVAIAWTVFGIRRKKQRWIVEGIVLFGLTVLTTALILSMR